MRLGGHTLRSALLLCRGRIAHLLGHRRSAAVLYIKAARANHTSPIAVSVSAHFLHCLGYVDVAIKVLEQADRRNSAEHIILELLASAYYTRGDLSRTVSAYERLHSIRKLEYQHSLIFARCLRELERYGEACCAYREALEQEPNSVEARYGLAYALAARGQSESALQAVDLVLTMEPEHPYGLSLKGELLLRKGCGEESLCYLRKAAHFAPRDARHWWRLAAALDVLGQEREAKSACRKAKQLQRTQEGYVRRDAGKLPQ